MMQKRLCVWSFICRHGQPKAELIQLSGSSSQARERNVAQRLAPTIEAAEEELSKAAKRGKCVVIANTVGHFDLPTHSVDVQQEGQVGRKTLPPSFKF